MPGCADPLALPRRTEKMQTSKRQLEFQRTTVSAPDRRTRQDRLQEVARHEGSSDRDICDMLECGPPPTSASVASCVGLTMSRPKVVWSRAICTFTSTAISSSTKSNSGGNPNLVKSSQNRPISSCLKTSPFQRKNDTKLRKQQSDIRAQKPLEAQVGVGALQEHRPHRVDCGHHLSLGPVRTGSPLESSHPLFRLFPSTHPTRLDSALSHRSMDPGRDGGGHSGEPRHQELHLHVVRRQGLLCQPPALHLATGWKKTKRKRKRNQRMGKTVSGLRGCRQSLPHQTCRTCTRMLKSRNQETSRAPGALQRLQLHQLTLKAHVLQDPRPATRLGPSSPENALLSFSPPFVLPFRTLK